MTTPEQKAFFETFGFIQLRQQFSAEEMEAVTREQTSCGKSSDEVDLRPVRARTFRKWWRRGR